MIWLILYLVGGWAHPKNDGVKVSWDHEIPNIWVTIFKKYEFVNGKDYPIYYGKIKLMFQTTNHIYIYG